MQNAILKVAEGISLLLQIHSIRQLYYEQGKTIPELLLKPDMIVILSSNIST